MASILFLLVLLSTLYLVSKVKAAQEGACIFLPLFPVSPYQSEKVVATPTREIEVQAAGRALKKRNAAPSDHRHKNDAPYLPYSVRLHLQRKSHSLQPEILLWSPGCSHRLGNRGGFTRRERPHSVV